MTWTETLSWGRNRRHRIFISYRRRGDGAGYGGRLADSLVEHFGREQCFRDVEDIESGVDFVETIRSSVAACEVLIAVIGPDWTTQADPNGRPRLEDPNDFVRLEVAAALDRDIRVVPVLVGGAQVPKEDELPAELKALSRRQAHELTDSRWEYDVQRLLKSIESIGIKSRSPSDQAARRRRLRRGGLAVGFGTLLLGMVVAADQYSVWQRVATMANLAVQERATSTTIQQFESELERERRQRNEAQRQAELERQRRLEAEQQAAIERASLREQDERVAANDQQLYGSLVVRWIHQGAAHEAEVFLDGPTGYATVTIEDGMGTFVEVEQDLYLEERWDGVFYVGSSPRVLDTNMGFIPPYSPDIFRIERLGGGRWTISEVGANWGHFDRAIASAS